jgi:hypothetical protein
VLYLFSIVFVSGSVAQKPVLLFNSGFEENSKVIPRSKAVDTDDDIVGKDLSLDGPNDWVEDIDENSQLGNFNLQYQGGDISMRFARIVPEPNNPDNKVLHFWVNQPNVNGTKARIQANIYESRAQKMEGIKELYQSVRIFIPKEMEVLKSYPGKIGWFTILEVWNNIQWIDDPFPFRITAGIGKPTAEKSELHFLVGAEDYEYANDDNKGKYIELWHEMNTKINVPLGKWITLEYYIKEGDKNTGRFYMLMTPDGGEKQMVFDIHNYTHNSNDPDPDGITLWNPMKLYTSKNLVNFVKKQGLALELYWDDFVIWKNKLPEINE